MRNTTAKNRVEREEKKLTGSSNLPFKTFYKFNEAPFWFFCWPDRMLWGPNFKVVTWPKKRSERGKIYNYWWHDTFLTTLTLGWVTLTQSWSWGKKNQPPTHDIIMVSEPRLQGREEGNICWLFCASGFTLFFNFHSAQRRLFWKFQGVKTMKSNTLTFKIYWVYFHSNP